MHKCAYGTFFPSINLSKSTVDGLFLTFHLCNLELNMQCSLNSRKFMCIHVLLTDMFEIKSTHLHVIAFKMSNDCKIQI